MVREAHELHEKLKQANVSVQFHFFRDKRHGDVLHGTLYQAFEDLYRPTSAKP
jgi:hypothetical protein